MPDQPRPYWRPHEWLTRAQAVEYTGFSKNTIRRAAQAGDLEEGGTEGKRMYQRQALDAWLRLRALRAKRGSELIVLMIALTLAYGVGCQFPASRHVMRELHLPCMFPEQRPRPTGG